MTPQERERPLSPEAVMREKLIEAFGMVAAYYDLKAQTAPHDLHLHFWMMANKIRYEQRSLLERTREAQ